MGAPAPALASLPISAGALPCWACPVPFCPRPSCHLLPQFLVLPRIYFALIIDLWCSMRGRVHLVVKEMLDMSPYRRLTKRAWSQARFTPGFPLVNCAATESCKLWFCPLKHWVASVHGSRLVRKEPVIHRGMLNMVSCKVTVHTGHLFTNCTNKQVWIFPVYVLLGGDVGN